MSIKKFILIIYWYKKVANYKKILLLENIGGLEKINFSLSNKILSINEYENVINLNNGIKKLTKLFQSLIGNYFEV